MEPIWPCIPTGDDQQVDLLQELGHHFLLSANHQYLRYRPFYQNGPPTPFDSGTAIICNGDNKAATASATVTAGSTITLNWDWNSVHPGPVMGYVLSFLQ